MESFAYKVQHNRYPGNLCLYVHRNTDCCLGPRVGCMVRLDEEVVLARILGNTHPLHTLEVPEVRFSIPIVEG